MGLDVYAVRPNHSQVPDMSAFDRLPEDEREEITWLPPGELGSFRAIPRDVAVGGLSWPSDGDPSGFRGKVYERWLSDEFGSSLYEPFDPEDVRTLLENLDDWLARAERGEVAVPLFGHASDEYALTRVRSFIDFVRASAQQQLWFYPDF